MVYGWLQRRFKGMFWEVVLFAIGEKRRPAGAGRLNIPLAKRPAVKLALLEDLLRAVCWQDRTVSTGRRNAALLLSKRAAHSFGGGPVWH
jgi:hypothetical protein